MKLTKVDIIMIAIMLILAILIFKDVKQVNSDPSSQEIADYYKSH